MTTTVNLKARINLEMEGFENDDIEIVFTGTSAVRGEDGWEGSVYLSQQTIWKNYQPFGSADIELQLRPARLRAGTQCFLVEDIILSEVQLGGVPADDKSLLLVDYSVGANTTQRRAQKTAA